jgi:feruloyl esterase
LIQRDFAAIPDALTAILPAQMVSCTAQTPDYCKVKGYVTPQVQFEVRLPTQNWNRHYLQVNCGGYCDSLRATPESIAALNQNFAVAFDNTGHVGDGIGAGSALWGLDQPQLQIDFGNRSEYVTALAAKAMATAFYGENPRYSYSKSNFSHCEFRHERHSHELAGHFPSLHVPAFSGCDRGWQ